MISVDSPLVLLLLVPAGVVLALALWALRRHRRMFPKGWDRTGWEPNSERERHYETNWTYRGGSGGL
jgi:hypothetical protein